MRDEPIDQRSWLQRPWRTRRGRILWLVVVLLIGIGMGLLGSRM